MKNNEPENDPQFEILLGHLKRTRGFDFTGYKRSSLMRRVNRRLQTLGIVNYVDYVDFLEVHPQEFEQLFNTILINVTSFFRDEEPWEYLAKEIVPRIIKKNTGEIRIWSAGCASGQEAYTIAIIMCEALGIDNFHKQVKIYATDVDEEALLHARQATYTAEDLEAIPEHLREKYFVGTDNARVFRPDLRRSVIFGRHDLVQDAPISKLDLLICRNTLMYMNAETQARILARMNFALRDDGFLFLGKAEMLLSHSHLFAPVDSRFRIFSKAGMVDRRNRLLVMAQTNEIAGAGIHSEHTKMREISFKNSLVAQIVVDKDGRICLFNNQAVTNFGLGPHDNGRFLKDMEISYRPVDLRSMLDQAMSEMQTIRAARAPYAPSKGDTQYYDIQAVPVCPGGTPIGVSISFHNVTVFQKLYDTLKAAHEELETTNEELQSTNEELETTNEELQSTNEELETTNEELQSINEELETTNEELQSTNEELETTNQELRKLTDEVENSNNFLQCILSSMRYGVVVTDKNNLVQVWNNQCEDLWGLRSDEAAGQNLFQLDIGLPFKDMQNQIEEFAKQKEKFIIFNNDAIDRRGRALKVQTRVSHLANSAGKREGLVILMVRDPQNPELKT
jgi:two-component system CheB/CheR fusion protein